MKCCDPCQLVLLTKVEDEMDYSRLSFSTYPSHFTLQHKYPTHRAGRYAYGILASLSAMDPV